MGNHRFPVLGAGSFPTLPLCDFPGMDHLKKQEPNPKSAKVRKNLNKISVTTSDNFFLKPSEQVLWENLHLPPKLPGGGTKGAKSGGILRSCVFFLKNGSWNTRGWEPEEY